MGDDVNIKADVFINQVIFPVPIYAGLACERDPR